MPFLEKKTPQKNPKMQNVTYSNLCHVFRRKCLERLPPEIANWSPLGEIQLATAFCVPCIALKKKKNICGCQHFKRFYIKPGIYSFFWKTVMSSHLGPIVLWDPNKQDLTYGGHGGWCPSAHPGFPLRCLTPLKAFVFATPFSTSGFSMAIKSHFGKWDRSVPL